jgi:hypothetical protein
VNAAAGFPLKRIAAAVALSILVHSLLLWQWPKLDLDSFREPLPPLQAKLEPLPKLAHVPRKPKTHPAAQAKSSVEPVVAAPAVIAAAASAVAAAAETGTTDAPAPAAIEEAASPPLLPKHAQLHFAVQYGGGTFKVGEISHELDNIDGHYSLRAVTRTTGLVGIFKSYQLSQSSSGSLTKQGLRPESYTESKIDSSGTQTATARFAWDENKIYFADGSVSKLPEQAQDVLSLPYHLSQLPLNLGNFQITLSNGKNLRQHYLAVGDEGTITTAMGELRTVTLHKVHGANEEGLIIWLALEYRLLPVKILYLDKSGEVSANMVITDIRVSDE